MRSTRTKKRRSSRWPIMAWWQTCSKPSLSSRSWSNPAASLIKSPAFWSGFFFGVLHVIPGHTDNAIPVGASLLAMSSRAPRLSRMNASSLTTIASELAPTGVTSKWSELPWICDLRGAYWDWRYCRRCLSLQANASAWW
ncbi:hypothetical protein EMIT0196MI5_70190 [Pseudomonas sp. IT-196MI5]